MLVANTNTEKIFLEFFLANSDKALQDMEKRLEALAAKFMPLKALSTEVYAVYIPKSIEDFIAEGAAMKNCMGTYPGAVSEKRIVVYLRKDGHPFADVELDLNNKAVVQVRERGNKNAEKPAFALAEKLLRAALKIS